MQCETCGHDHLCYIESTPEDLGFCCVCDKEDLWDSPCHPFYEEPLADS